MTDKIVGPVEKRYNSTPLLSNRVYDKLRWITQYFLPASGTLYFALSGIWGFPYGEQIIGSLVALETFLGAILGISSVGYKASLPEADGVIEIDTRDPDKDSYLLVLDNAPENLKDMDKVTFKVNNKG